MSEEKISYIYPSPYTTGEDGKINAEPPTLAYQVNGFPCIFDVCANIGMAYLERGFEYNIETTLYFDDIDLTKEIEDSEIKNHRSHLTSNGDFVATFGTIIEGITIKKAGRYRLKCSLSRTPVDDELVVPVHEQECFFVISDKWAY